MSIRFGVVLISLLLLGSCAQVEPLSGGLRDENAPKPNMEDMSPKNGSTNFHGKELVIPFDEFFTLNNPAENIVVIPPDIKPKAKIKNKTLVLSWDEEIKLNTTYAFYLNGLVQDVTEKNDSLMSFVFSTGPTIDSLDATFFAMDAFSKALLDKQTIALYSNFSDTVLPDYFGKTDRNGKVKLSYLKPGTYQLVAFDDKNKDLKPQPLESFGFKLGQIELSETLEDTIPILVSPPKTIAQITNFQLNPPNTFFVAANRNLKNASYQLNGEILSDENIIFFKQDSVLLPFQWSDSSSYELVVKGEDWTDTAAFRLQNKDKNTALTLQLIDKKDLLADQAIRFHCNHLISSLDLPLISILNKTDSSLVPIRSIAFRETYVELNFDRKETISNIQVQFLPNAVQSSLGKNSDTLSFSIACLSQKDVGTLKVKLDGYENAVVLELLKSGKLVESIALEKSQKVYVFTHLLSGEYSFRIIDDLNGNGYWDGGDFDNKTMPEKVYIYPKSQKVRGNWDAEVTLNLSGDGD